MIIRHTTMAQALRTHFSPKHEGSSVCDAVLERETKSEPPASIDGDTGECGCTAAPSFDGIDSSVGGGGSGIMALREYPAAESEVRQCGKTEGVRALIILGVLCLDVRFGGVTRRCSGHYVSSSDGWPVHGAGQQSGSKHGMKYGMLRVMLLLDDVYVLCIGCRD